MNLNFLSGLLLITVVLAMVVFVAKEILDNRVSDDRRSIRKSLRFWPRASGREPEPLNNHLIGLVGKVISHSGDTARPMMVRVHPELWPARQESTAVAPLPVGCVVRVAAVDGSVLVVEASTRLGESPNVS
jgi:membrane protein implicated in regulation of membrane protease activity